MTDIRKKVEDKLQEAIENRDAEVNLFSRKLKEKMADDQTMTFFDLNTITRLQYRVDIFSAVAEVLTEVLDEDGEKTNENKRKEN